MILLTRPYVTNGEFRASPTWLDTENLVVDGDTVAQDAELTNVLLRASEWANGIVDQPLGAHTHTEQARAILNAAGRLSFHAAHSPVRKVTALSYGSDPSTLTAVPDLSGLWIEDDVQILTSLAVAAGFPGLEFGPPRVRGEVFVRMSYVAAYANTVLAANASSGATSLTVADTTGIYPGDVLRIWDPSREEAVTVSSGYTPGTVSVALASATTVAHSSGAGVSALPADAHQAVICRAVSMLLRGDTAGEGDYADAPFGPTGRTSGARSKVTELTAEATHLLRPYMRIR